MLTKSWSRNQEVTLKIYRLFEDFEVSQMGYIDKFDMLMKEKNTHRTQNSYLLLRQKVVK